MNTKRTAIGLTAAASVVAMAGTLTVPAIAAPRMSVDECAAQAASGSSYTVEDTAGRGTGCATGSQGRYMYVNGTNIPEGARVKGEVQLTATQAKSARGDKRRYARVYFIRGNKVLVKRVRITASGFVKFSRKLNKSGRWAVVVTRGGNTLSMTIDVT